MPNPDIIVVAACSPDARSAVVTVPLSPAQCSAASFGCVLDISPDNQANWFFGASSGFAGPDLTNRDGTTRTDYRFEADASHLPVPPTHVRVRITNPSDATLSPTIEAS